MNHNDYLFSNADGEFKFFRRFEEMYRNCEDPHGQSRELQRFDYGMVSVMLDRALAALELGREQASILDVGCGLGYFTTYIKKLLPMTNVAGCDISATAIAKAKANAPECDFFTADLKSRASLPRMSCDVVVALHVVCYFTEDEIPTVVQNLRALTKVGGFLLIGHHLPERMSFATYMRSLDDARRLFEPNGFKVRLAVDLTDNFELTYSGDPVGRNIYVLAQSVDAVTPPSIR